MKAVRSIVKVEYVISASTKTFQQNINEQLQKIAAERRYEVVDIKHAMNYFGYTSALLLLAEKE